MKTTRSINGGNDAYFTNPELALRYVKTINGLLGHVKFSAVIEPSAGNGSFLEPIKKYWKNVVGYDLFPACEDVIQSDWFNVTVPKNSLVIGNPPFGFAASLAVKFFNHAATGAKVIAFIVPRSFQKQSVHQRLNPHFHLVHEDVCPYDSFLVDGIPYDVPCVFQIWKRMPKRRVDPTVSDNPYFQFVKSDKASACIRRVGGRAGELLDGVNHSSSTTYFVIPLRNDSFDALDACQSALRMLRDKTAGVRSISKNELNAVLTAYFNGASHV